MSTTTLEPKKESASKRSSKKIKTPNNSEWMELIEEKDVFKHTVNIMNRYYSLHPSANHPTPTHLFREELVRTESESLRIFMKKFGRFEIFVVVEIHTGQGKKMDSWIHIDGISQEREMMTERGNTDHPVFKIVSMLDIFGRSTKKVEKGFNPTVDDV
jgi:hypothetical protein